MKKAILLCLCNAALFGTLCVPAQARMIVGFTPTAQHAEIDQAAISQLGKALTASAGTIVTIRRFDNAATITNWLLRFQEIDAAIVAPEFIKQQPAGALTHLADLHFKNNAAPPQALVIRSNLGNSQAREIKEAFLELGASDSGRKILEGLGLAGATQPGDTFRRKAAEPKQPPAQPVKTKTSLPPARTKQPTKRQEQVEVATAPKPEQPENKPSKPAIVQEQRPGEKAVAPEADPKAITKASSEPEPAAESLQKPVIQEPAKAVEATKPAVADQPTVVSAQQSTQQPRVEAAQPKPATDKRLLIFAALVLLLAILLKVCLFAMRWQSKRKAAYKPEETPTHGALLERKEVVTPTKTQKSPPAAEEAVFEVGQLGPGKVPELLKRCADLPKPVVLKITKGSCEKLVFFAGGQVSGALTQNATSTESGVRWNKLGNLLVREELITRDARDQGMALLAKNPELRFGEALLKLGLIDLAGLRHALTRQAKVTIYSLILFPEGRYQIFAGDGSLPPEESVSLEITNLIREASHHQSEWTAIRQALPNLSTALDFTPGGRGKLERVSISSQQEAALSLIDGKRTINDLCIESSMMDYEVYRFLYLMVKAGVLR